MQRKREFGVTLTELYNEVIGDRGKDMFELTGLATAPQKQGRGYATALAHVLNEMVSEHLSCHHIHIGGAC